MLQGLSRRLGGSSRGVTAIEAIVALGLLGLIAVTYLSGMATSFNANMLADERSTAQTIAQTHMEFIKTMPYSENAWDYTADTSTRSYTNKPDWWAPASGQPPLVSAQYQGYSVEASSESFDVDGDGSQDEGIRRVTVTVSHDGEEVLTLQDYEVDR